MAGRNPSRKLTDDQVAVIRELMHKGVAERKIAPMFGVSRPTINSIRRGRYYTATKVRERIR